MHIVLCVLQQYFRDVLALDITNNGLYLTVPFISQFICKLAFSVLVDKLKIKYGLTTIFTSKVMQAFCEQILVIIT